MVGVVAIWTMGTFLQPAGMHVKNALIHLMTVQQTTPINVGYFGTKQTHADATKAKYIIGRAINVWHRANDANNPL